MCVFRQITAHVTPSAWPPSPLVPETSGALAIPDPAIPLEPPSLANTCDFGGGRTKLVREWPAVAGAEADEEELDAAAAGGLPYAALLRDAIDISTYTSLLDATALGWWPEACDTGPLVYTSGAVAVERRSGTSGGNPIAASSRSHGFSNADSVTHVLGAIGGSYGRFGGLGPRFLPPRPRPRPRPPPRPPRPPSWRPLPRLVRRHWFRSCPPPPN